ncbi:Ankyrin repeat and KH domain-containing protein 1 [Cytospora mali]|uniref:Ankyrin repeat and KH domain-containing protein 1 n=1 Tax=Cytospora mali TaxID=578113 RepID=A0A194UTL3_CYTMA|nr:Ankyrin repeat and KH domain-containing protein 1 [Valsa mali var. pyri (nom. inval.)]
MSTSKRPLSDEADDIWRQNEAEIRELYQEKRETLKDVKRIMEAKGFPKKPLSTWESKLRDELGLRKKARTNDWPLIYRHVLPRLEHPKRKKPKKPTGVYINNTIVEWDKAWKEMRRSGVLAKSPYQGQCSHATPRASLPTRLIVPLSPDKSELGALSPLPGYIAVRTPSPFQQRLPHELQDVAAIRSPSPFQLELQEARPAGTLDWGEQPQSAIIAPKSTASFAGRLSVDCRSLENLPGLQFTKRLLSASMHRMPNFYIKIDDIDIPLHLVPIAILNPSESEGAPDFRNLLTDSTSTALVSTFDTYHYLSIAVYLLSNHLINLDESASVSEVLEIFSRRIPQSLFAEVLQINIPSMRAAWEILIRAWEMSSYKALFRILVRVGIRNRWLDVDIMGHEYLYYAARLNCIDAVKALLDAGCRPDTDMTRQASTPAILEAIQTGAFEVALLLIQYCNINEQFVTRGYIAGPYYFSNFQRFMLNYKFSYEHRLRGLFLFLENGANIDEAKSEEVFIKSIKYELRDVYTVLIDYTSLWPTFLDYHFLVDRSIFNELVEYGMPAKITRWKVWLALEQPDGVERLRLQLRQLQISHKKWQQFLQLLFVEQFLIGTSSDIMLFKICNYKTRLRLIQGFLELGIDPSLPGLRIDATDLLCALICHMKKKDFATEEMITAQAILDSLCTGENRAIVDHRLLCDAVQEEGTAIMKPLVKFAANISLDGTSALAEAARLNNFDAVRLLLNSGVDIKAFSLEYRSIERRGNLRCKMVNFLIERGAQFEDAQIANDAAQLLESLLTLLKEGSYDLFDQVIHVVDELGDVRDETISYSSARLLENCLHCGFARNEYHERLKVFELLYQRGAALSPGSPLALLISAGGRKTLVEEILNSGADINAYSKENSSITPLQAASSRGDEELISQLLDRGAQVNAAAVGIMGKTALQHICAWQPVTSEERVRKMKIIQTFLAHGADVNAPGEDYTVTALAMVALTGELEVANLLLSYGVDDNSRLSAFVTAVEFGRLDMVQMLLNAGALSSRCGATGYDGAINLAKAEGYFAIVDLISNHAKAAGFRL